MKKTYITPDINVIGFEADDIIQTSGIVQELAPTSWSDAVQLESQNINIFE